MCLKLVRRRPLLVTRHRFSIGSSGQFFALVAFLILVLLAPVQAAGQVLLGDQAIESSVDGSRAGMAEAFQSTATTTGALGSLTLYVDSSSLSRQIFVGLYANAAGHPGVLLAQGSSSVPRAGAWNTVTISPVNVTAGTRYWIAVLGTSGTLQFRDSIGGCSSESSAQSNLAALSANWSSGAIWSTCRLSAYGSAAASSQPILSISPSTLSFTATQGGTNPTPASMNVSNAGTGTLNLTDSSDATWLAVSPASGTAPQTLQVSAMIAGMAANTYTGHLTITAPGSQGSPAVVTVTLNLSAPAPLPSPILNLLIPANVNAGSSAFTLTANGTNFISGDVVLWNGAALITNLVSATQLTAAVPASLVASAGTASVVVQPPSGSNSNALNFTINALPAPTISSLSPASATAGGSGFNLTVNGTSFGSGATVLWNGSALTTTFGSATQLTAAVPASLIASPGSASVSVQASGGATSNSSVFVINAPAPAVTSLSPATATAGGSGFALIVKGTNFVSGATVLWNGSPLTTTFDSAAQLTAAVPASLITSPGSASISVQTSGGATSNSITFAINTSQQTVLIGIQTVQSGSDSNSAGQAEAFQATAGATGTLGSLVVYIDSSSSATQLTAGLYSDASGRPGTLLSQGSSSTISPAAWNPISISSASVVAGTRYWIAVLGTGGTLRYRDGSGCTSITSAQSTLTTLPPSWSSGPSWPSCPLSAYGISAGGGAGGGTSYAISGTISSTSGGSGATVVLSGTAAATTTASGSGTYSFSGLANGNYSVTPSNAGYIFSPSNQPVTINGGNVTGVNFTAIPATTTYTISGTLSGAGGSGATVALSGAATAAKTADGSGNYSFNGLANGNYAVTPGRSGYSFSPTSQTATINGANVTGVNFTATSVAPTYSISGTISPASSGAGSVVTLSGAASFSTTADSSGNYSFTSLANGAYTVTPSSQAATFTPTSQPVTVSNGNVSGVNFTATATANVIFFDDFNGSTLSADWTVVSRHGEYAQFETECNTPQQVSVANGALIITTAVGPATCGDFNIDGSVRHSPSSWRYITGDIQWTSKNFTFGTVEYRAKFPPQNTGVWPAVWLLGANCQLTNIFTADTGYSTCPQIFTPGYVEIDATECDLDNWCQLLYYSATSDSFKCAYPVDTNWHVYSLSWTSKSLSMTVDGQSTGCTFNANNSSVPIPSTPMFLLIQTQTGGAGGTPNDALLPTQFLVDYVKVTQP